MQTLWRDKGAYGTKERGVSLLEMLVVLGVIASSAAIAAAGFRSGGARSLNLAASHLEADLKAARLYARTRSEAVSIVFKQSGYQVEALGLKRLSPRGVSFSVSSGVNQITFTPEVDVSSYEIRVTDGRAARAVRVAPLTGRITSLVDE